MDPPVVLPPPQLSPAEREATNPLPLLHAREPSEQQLVEREREQLLPAPLPPHAPHHPPPSQRPTKQLFGEEEGKKLGGGDNNGDSSGSSVVPVNQDDQPWHGCAEKKKKKGTAVVATFIRKRRRKNNSGGTQRKRPTRLETARKGSDSGDSGGGNSSGDDIGSSTSSFPSSGAGAAAPRIAKVRRVGSGALSHSTATRDLDSAQNQQQQPVVSAATSAAGVMAAGTVIKSTRSAEPSVPRDMGATAVNEVATETDRDARALFEKQQRLNAAALQAPEDNVYRGRAGYQTFHSRGDTVGGNAYRGATSQGPMRATQHIRSTVRWDYQPDVCKDYKETGYCGYGDSCKFLHDRSDYKSGWQIERDVQDGTWAAAQNAAAAKKKKNNKEGKSEGGDEEEELPFACFICRRAFTNPVVTTCKHYFCEACALAHHRKSKKCYVCGVKTGGLFKPAKELIKRLKDRKDAEAC